MSAEKGGNCCYRTPKLTEQSENVYENKGSPSKTDASGEWHWVARTGLRLRPLTEGHCNPYRVALPGPAPAEMTKCHKKGAPGAATRTEHDKALDKAFAARV